MAHYQHDGHRFDLNVAYVDVTGTEWRWTGKWTVSEFPEPLMQSGHRGQFADNDTVIPLPDLYRDRGPLIKVLAPVPASARRAALLAAPSPGFAATAASGYVEDLDAFTTRIFPRGTRNA